MLRYRLSIEGLLKDGHPVQFFETHHDTAFQLGKEMAGKYPDKNVRLFESLEKEVGFWPAVAPVQFLGYQNLACPRGHSGTLLSGKPVWDGRKCGICGAEAE